MLPSKLLTANRQVAATGWSFDGGVDDDNEDAVAANVRWNRLVHASSLDCIASAEFSENNDLLACTKLLRIRAFVARPPPPSPVIGPRAAVAASWERNVASTDQSHGGRISWTINLQQRNNQPVGEE